MVLGQCMILPRLFQSQISSPCQTSDQCEKPGTFCSKAGGWQDFGSGGCVYCGTYAPMDFQWSMDGRTWNFPEDRTQPREWQLTPKMYNASHALEICRDPTKSYVIWPPQGHGPKPPRAGYNCIDMSANGPNPPFNIRTPRKCPGAEELGDPHPYYEEFVRSWCHRCVDPITGEVDPLNGDTLPSINIRLMVIPDWAAYIFCSVLVSLTMVGELKDIMLVSFAIQNAHLDGKLSTGWRFTLSLLNKSRRWVFIPALMITGKEFCSNLH
jgi:hypothetical protein